MANNKAGGKKSRKNGKKGQPKQTQSQQARDTTVKRKRSRGKGGQKWQGADGVWVNESNFVKLALDPCNGPITASPFGATANSYIWRLNYRRTVTSNATGHFMAALYPTGIWNAFGSVAASTPQPIQLWGGSTFNDSAVVVSTGADQFPGSQAIATMAAQARVTAGCIKLKYLGPAASAAGELYGWEGQGDENFAHSAGTGNMTNRSTPQYFVTNGRPKVITEGVESILNFSKVPARQTDYGDVQVARTDVFCPMAVVGVSGGPASTNYVVEATIIIEWTPMLSSGIPNPTQYLFKPGAAERVANALKAVSPLLVRAGSTALGGYAGAFNTALKFGKAVYKAM